MSLLRKKHYFYLVFLGFALVIKPSVALEFNPGVGVGLQYTNNARLAPTKEVADVIAIGQVGAQLVEEQGLLLYDVSGVLSKETYINDTFDDKRYLNLAASANWEMIRERVDWFLTDNFYQSPVVTLDANTPDNRQDTNSFIFGTNINFPISGLQNISLVPQYSKYYYEISGTSNQQYSVAANWNYQVFRLTGVGLQLLVRQIQYDDLEIADATFANYGFIISGSRVNTEYTINIGSTTVSREATVAADAEEFTGFAGNASWRQEVSSRSTIEALVLTEITDTSTVSQSAIPGDPNDVQLSTDVIRNSVARLTYSRADASLHTSIWAEYRKIRYSDNTDLSRLVQTFGAQLDFPVTQLVSSGVFLNFNNTKGIEFFREDKRFNIGTNVQVLFTANLSSTFDVRYQTKESTDSSNNYDEFSVFASLNYGFAGVGQRTINR